MSIIRCGTSSLNTFKVVCIKLQRLLSIHECLFVFFYFNITLRTIAENNTTHNVVTFWNMSDTSCVTVDCSFIIKWNKIRISLLFQLLCHRILLNWSTFNDNLCVRLSTACSLHHLSLCHGTFTLFSCLRIFSRNEIFVFNFLVIIFIDICFLIFRVFFPSIIIIKHRSYISFQLLFFLVIFRIFRLIRIFGRIFLIFLRLPFLFIIQFFLNIHSISNRRQWYLGSSFNRLCW